MAPVPQNKEELVKAITQAFEKLLEDYQSIPSRMSREPGIEGNVKGTLISVCDTVAYLVGWERLVLKWHRLRSQGKEVDFPETGYKWNQLGDLAVSFHEQYSDWSYEKLLNEFENVTNEILLVVTHTSNEKLYETAWYDRWTFGRMIQLNTSSPMKNMRTKVRRFKKSKGIS